MMKRKRRVALMDDGREPMVTCDERQPARDQPNSRGSINSLNSPAGKKVETAGRLCCWRSAEAYPHAHATRHCCPRHGLTHCLLKSDGRIDHITVQLHPPAALL